jgi:fumarate reductase subunit C
VTPAGAATARWLAQRVSAGVLAVCVLVHLATIVYATRHGLAAEALRSRVHASLAWPVFYGVFVVAVAVHAPLGLRVILDEWSGLRGRALDVLLAVFALTLLVGGWRAIAAVAA